MGSVAGPRAYATATSTTASTPINLGGKDLLSAAQMSLVRRAAALGCELEQVEGRMSLG